MSPQPPELLNFRDVGALLRSNGLDVRPGQLFRSGVLAWPDQSQLDPILGFGPAVVIDLRSPNERRRVAPLSQFRTGRYLTQVVSEIEEAAPHLFLPGQKLTVRGIRAYYLGRYAEMATGHDYEKLFGRGFNALASSSGPVLVHCSAGKDRTGLFVALALKAIGIPVRLIKLDYLASNDAPGLELSVFAAMSRFASEVSTADRALLAATLAQARWAYVETALEAIRAKHGSVRAYFDAVGFDEAARISLQRRLFDGPEAG